MCLGIPGQVVSIDTSNELLRFAKVDFGGLVKTISLAYTPEARVGQYVIVHVGFAISIIDEAAAKALLAEIDRLDIPE